MTSCKHETGAFGLTRSIFSVARRGYRVCAQISGTLLLILLFFSGSAAANVTIQLQTGESEAEQLLANYLVDSNILSDFVELIDQNFQLDPQMVLAIGASEGPDYNHETHVLRMPFSYFSRAVETQAELVETREEALARALDVVEYTLYHLLGHALIDSSDVFEDVRAEEVSTWVVLTHWPNGGEQWKAAADAFGEASQKLDGPLEDFWHSHSLYDSRQKEINCLILGENPEEYEKLLPAVLDTADRKARCREQWRTLHEKSLNEFADLLLEDAPIRTNSN